MNLASYILKALHKEKISHFFMVPGRLINPFMACYSKSSCEEIKPIVAAFEGGAAIMADGYARASERFGVAILLDGPGVVNAIGAIANAYADGFPILLLAGQIAKDYEMMGALQDSTQSGLDLSSVLKPLTYQSFHIRNSENASRYFREVIKGMFNCNKRPSYLAISKDVLLHEETNTYREIPLSLTNPKLMDNVNFNLFADSISSEDTITILVGSRANKKTIADKLTILSEEYNVSVCATISSKGIFPEKHTNYLGVYGYSGHRRALYGILTNPSDIIILLGFDTTQWTTLMWDMGIRKAKQIVQIGTRQGDMDFIIEADRAIICEEEVFIDELINSRSLQVCKEKNKKRTLLMLKQPLLYEYEKSGHGLINPAEAVTLINSIFEDYICVADSGNHRSFATHYWLCKNTRSFFSANTICSMGWAIPASIGISLQRKEPCVVLTGDGCMLMHGIEIQTAARYGLDITYIVFNNSYYGATYFNNIDNVDDMSKLPTHDWVKFAESLGVEARRVETIEELNAVLHDFHKKQGALLIDMICSHAVETPVCEYKSRVKAAGGRI